VVLFYAVWAERNSILIDAADLETARTAVTEIADGEAPERIAELRPGVFVAEVVYQELDDEDEDGDDLVLAPFDHVADMLDAIESFEVCGAEAELDGGEVVRCTREKHASGEHEARAGDGSLATWN
jgi:hypothetical protein